MRGLTTTSLMLAVLLTLNACTDNTSSPPEAVKAQALPRLLDLGSHKCIPCQRMTPILAELKDTYAGVFDVQFLDVWEEENKEAAAAHAIESIPTQIFFDAAGKELWRHEGFISKEDILSRWGKLGYTFKPVTPGAPSAKEANE